MRAAGDLTDSAHALLKVALHQQIDQLEAELRQLQKSPAKNS